MGRLVARFRGLAAGPRTSRRQGLPGRRACPFRRWRRRPAFEGEQALIQVLDQLIDAPFQRALAELQLLDPSGQLPELLLDAREAHLEPGEPSRIVGLDQLQRARGIELAAQTVEPRCDPSDRRVSGPQASASRHTPVAIR